MPARDRADSAPAEGMPAVFGGVFGRRRGQSAAKRQRQETMTEMRFHAAVPATREGARQAATAVAGALHAKLGGACAPTGAGAATPDAAAFRNGEAALLAAYPEYDPPPPAPARQIETPQITLKYSVRDGRNDAAGPTLLLLHGVGTTRRCFDSLSFRLSVRAVCRVVAPDLRGHGGSSCPTTSDAPYAPHRIVDDLVQLVLALDLYTQPLFVLGHGKLGGDAALGLAAKHPKLVGALFLLEYAAEGIPRDLAAYHPLQAARFPGHQAAFDTLGSELLQWRFRVRDAGGSEVPARARPAKGVLRQTLACVRDAGEGHVEVAMDARFCYIGLARDDVVRLLGALPDSLTLCCCVGADSVYTSEACVRRTLLAASHVRRKKLEVLPRCGHDALFDDVLHVYTALKGFLAKSWRGLVLGPEHAAERTPERLGLRELEEFESVEAARKVLGPRRLPTPEEIEAAYAIASADDEAPDDGGDGDGSRARQTALAQNDAEYFGFVG